MEFKVTKDNFDVIQSMNDAAIKQALEVCGGTAENYAKKLCPVDTGLNDAPFLPYRSTGGLRWLRGKPCGVGAVQRLNAF